MSFGDDFGSVDPASAPLDRTILIGADPLFWGAVLLAVVVAALIGWLLAGSRPRRADAAPLIWTAIDEAAKAAMKADTDSLPARAADLQRVLRTRLGRTLAFGGELNRCIGALDAALAGEVAEPRPHSIHEPAASSTAHDDTHAEPGEAPHAGPSSAASVTIVSVHAPPAPARPHPPEHGKRPMTTKQRNDALRLAVAEFNDYWRHRAARENDMRAVIAELCNPGPRRPPAGHNGGHR